jgi:hypothetical protein
VLATTLLVGALLLQGPTDAATTTGPAAVTDESGLAEGTPQWFATEEPAFRWGFRNFSPRVGIGHRSQGYGYDRGYTGLEAFVPVIQDEFEGMFALQGNYLVDNGGEYGFNAGLIHRQYNESWDRIFGLNFFYDHRREDGSSFNQVGFGIESLGSYFDWRANGYVPVGDDLFPADGGGITYAEFLGRRVMVNFLANKALTGFDTELGGIVPSTMDVLRAYAGFYHFFGDESDDLYGVQGRLEARVQDSLTLHLAVTNDGTFDTNVVVGLELTFPGFAPRNTPAGGRAAGRLGEPIRRNQNIIIERSPLKDPVSARWTDGSLIEVVHIDNLALINGPGTVFLPYATLAEGQAAAQPGSILFVHANGTYDGESVVLQNGQQLLGEGIDHPIQSMYGWFLLPRATREENILDVPLIDNAPGDAVTLASNNTVAGFRIFDAGGHGVTGATLLNTTLHGLGIQSSGGSGIQLDGVAGNISIYDNFSLSNGDNGIAVSTALIGDNTIAINDNTVLGNPGEGIDITTRGDTDTVLYIERNLVRVSLGPTNMRGSDPPNFIPGLPLVRIDALHNSRLRARIEENTIEDSFARDDTSPDEDPFYDQLSVNAWHNSQVDVGFIRNDLQSNRRFLFDNPANGSFGIDVSSSDLATLRARFDSNISELNYGVAENFISVFQLEDTLETNTGDFFYFPTAQFFDVLPAGTIDLP